MAPGKAVRSASVSSATGAPPTRTAIGWQSGLPSASSASPRRPVTAAISALPRGVVESIGASRRATAA